MKTKEEIEAAQADKIVQNFHDMWKTLSPEEVGPFLRVSQEFYTKEFRDSHHKKVAEGSVIDPD